MADLLATSRKLVEDVEESIRNLKRIDGLTGIDKTRHANALSAAENALSGATALRNAEEHKDANALAGLLGGIDLTGDLSRLDQAAGQELEELGKVVDGIHSPNVDKAQAKKIVEDLHKEIAEMKSAALKKGIGFLAMIARTAIPFL